MTWTISAADIDYIFRILLSALCGALIGIERERRLKTAGIRTHIIVALSATLMMIISKYGFFDILGIDDSLRVDASRVAAGVVQAIGFLGAGVIFVRKENVSGVTTAAGLWATVGIGLAIGAGLNIVGIATTLIILLIQLLLHKNLHLFPAQFVGSITMMLPISQFNVDLLKHDFETAKIQVRSMEMERIDEANYRVKVAVLFPKRYTDEQLLELFKSKVFITRISYYQSVQ
jgi:Uncharacterized membrane protein